ncbi:DUF2637 domain-containing protein [Streptomyces sp. NPDC051214]|uniref:DUF2637 domain-containing protein n=1 Tax=Streptomyces sp. NPDC051214 TaxID=3155282 RepID=UPI0034153920
MVPAQTEQAPPLTQGEKLLLGVAVIAGAGVGGLGLASSYDSLSVAAARWGFSDPWMVPVGIDVAIPVFTAARLLLIRLNMPLAWVHFAPWALTLVTCWLNIAAGTTVSAKLAHGSMPLLWVGLSEVAAHVYAVRVGVATGQRMERIRRSRWLIAPRTTLMLWRRMVLWETTDYRKALALEKQRLLVRAELRADYGRAWRRKAPVRDLVLLKLGELAPDGSVPTGEADEADEADEQESVAESGETPEPRRRRPARTDKSSPRMTWGQALAKAREKTSDWPVERLDAEPIRKVVGCSQDRSRQLRDVLRAERHELQTEAEAVDALS